MSNQFTDAVNMVYDFHDFVRACEWMWYSDGLTQEGVNRLPLGSRFYALYAPHANLKYWQVTWYEVRMVGEIIKLGKYRAYVVLERIRLEYAPFAWSQAVEGYELPQEKMKQVA